MFEICTAMLSKQPHYEFGLRSIKSVIQLSVTMKATTMTTSQEEVSIFFCKKISLPFCTLFKCHPQMFFADRHLFQVILFNAVHRMKFSELLPEDQTLFLR